MDRSWFPSRAEAEKVRAGEIRAGLAAKGADRAARRGGLPQGRVGDEGGKAKWGRNGVTGVVQCAAGRSR